jgi:hypothetical protein
MRERPEATLADSQYKRRFEIEPLKIFEDPIKIKEKTINIFKV